MSSWHLWNAKLTGPGNLSFDFYDVKQYQDACYVIKIALHDYQNYVITCSSQDIDAASHYCPFETEVTSLERREVTTWEVKYYQVCDDYPESQIISRDSLQADSKWCTVNV